MFCLTSNARVLRHLVFVACLYIYLFLYVHHCYLGNSTLRDWQCTLPIQEWEPDETGGGEEVSLFTHNN